MRTLLLMLVLLGGALAASAEVCTSSYGRDVVRLNWGDGALEHLFNLPDDAGWELQASWPYGAIPTCAEIEALAPSVLMSACVDKLRGSEEAHIAEFWPPLLVRMYDSGEPVSALVACYNEDLYAMEAARASALTAFESASLEVLHACDPPVWPTMRPYTQAQIDAGEVTPCN